MFFNFRIIKSKETLCLLGRLSGTGWALLELSSNTKWLGKNKK